MQVQKSTLPCLELGHVQFAPSFVCCIQGSALRGGVPTTTERAATQVTVRFKKVLDGDLTDLVRGCLSVFRVKDFESCMHASQEALHICIVVTELNMSILHNR